MKSKVFLVFLIGLGIAIALLYSLSYQDRSAPGVREFTVEMLIKEKGGFSPDTLEVSRGDTVIIHFKSVDVSHGAAIGPTSVVMQRSDKVVIIPDAHGALTFDTGPIGRGQDATVKFVAMERGTFTFYCTVWCSPRHHEMYGTFIVR